MEIDEEQEVMDQYWKEEDERRIVALEAEVVELRIRVELLEGRGKALDQLIRSAELAIFQR